MMNTQDTPTPHPLRTIILRSDGSITAPEFEKLALKYYKEIHDRTWEIQQRIKQGRIKAASFDFQLEDIQELFEQAQQKFRHLEIMLAENPEKGAVRTQLMALLGQIYDVLDDFVPELVNAVQLFYQYDDYIYEQEQWMDEIAFPQFDKVFKDYGNCSIDMVSFDRDLDDFKGALRFVKDQERKYYVTMNELIERYSDLNLEIDRLFEQVQAFDDGLLNP